MLLQCVAALAVVEILPGHLIRGQAQHHQLFGTRLIGRLALGADGTHQALGDDGLERGRDQEGLEAHVQQTGDRGRRIIGMQGGEHDVTGQRGLDRDLRGLEVTDLTDQDLVGVLTQDRAQTVGEGRSISSSICTWIRPSISYSTGSSVVMILTVSSLASFRAAYSVVVLPEPVGPVTTTMPFGFLMTSRK